MTDEQRAARVTELRALRRIDPAAVIALYRRQCGKGIIEALPHGLSLPQMIQAIADKEAVGGK